MTQTAEKIVYATETEQHVIDCLRALAHVCDYASTHDNQGFNGVDTRFGHDLAEKSVSYKLTAKQLQSACKMMQKYRKQLTRMGHTLPTNAELQAELAPKTPEQLAQANIARVAASIELDASDAAHKLAAYDFAHETKREGDVLKRACQHYGNALLAQWNNLTIAETQAFAVVYARTFYAEYKASFQTLLSQAIEDTSIHI